MGTLQEFKKKVEEIIPQEDKIALLEPVEEELTDEQIAEKIAKMSPDAKVEEFAKLTPEQRVSTTSTTSTQHCSH